MKFVIDIPVEYVNHFDKTPTLIIPYYLKGGISKKFYTTICLEPYEEQEIKVRNDIIEALEILRDSMGEIEETFTGMIESIRRENEG